MDLDRNNAADLAQFFAKRFPHPHERKQLVDEARMVFREPASNDTAAAWGTLLTRAQEQKAVRRLADAASAQDPDDENLQAVCAILAGRPWPPVAHPQRTAFIGGSAVAVVLGIAAAAALALMPFGEDEAPGVETAGLQAEPAPAFTSAVPRASAPPRAPTPRAEATPAPPTAASPPPVAAPKAPVHPPASAGSAEGSKPAPEQRKVAAAAPTASAAGTDRPHHTGRCTTDEGGLVGYWYAGSEKPGEKGDIITVDRTAFVRADYPDSHNQYNARAAVRCSVLEGDKLLLQEAPVAVPGDAYWIPVYSGTIQ